METMQMTKNVAFLLLLFSLCNPGNAGYCSISDLVVTQTPVPSSNNIYAVTVENRCICTQANVKLACGGFSSFVAVDPEGGGGFSSFVAVDPEGVLSVDGDGKLCTLDGGRPIGMGPEYAVKFSYVSPSAGQIGFKPVSSSIACS